jgi:hypothetical protein
VFCVEPQPGQCLRRFLPSANAYKRCPSLSVPPTCFQPASLSAVFSEVERVTVRRPQGPWVSLIVEADAEFSWVDITPVELPFDLARRHAAG